MKINVLHDHNYISANSSLASIKVGCINVHVCGLYSKLKCQEFVELVSKYDLFGCSETKHFDYNNVSVVNYSVFPKENVLERSKCQGNRFSGVCLFVHNM